MSSHYGGKYDHSREVKCPIPTSLTSVERINEAKKTKMAVKEKKGELIASAKKSLPTTDEKTQGADNCVDDADGQWRKDILQGRKNMTPLRRTGSLSRAFTHGKHHE